METVDHRTERNPSDELDFSTNSDDYPESTGPLPKRRRLLIGVVIAAGLAVWVAGAVWMANAAEIRLAAVPGSKHNLLLPPERMQRDIAALIRAGKAPKHAALSMRDLKAACLKRQVEWVLLGCAGGTVNTLLYGAPILIWDGLRGDDRHYVLVHEMAHHLYGWRH